MACRPVLPLLLLTLLSGLQLCRDAVAAEPETAAVFQPPELNVADGFTVEMAAGPPLVDRPITMAFDEQGRLYVSDSSGSNDPVDRQLAERPHRILRLEDTNGDGRFDRRTVFADQMMFPEGTMWFRGSLYVAAPPSIWKLTDTDGDGVADRREEWFTGKTLTGCANDLHGPYRSRDGWIYWTKGAFAEQTYDLPGRPAWKTRASHIFRARPDGSGLEPVMTGGMDNPVDLVFTAEGERILSNTFLHHRGGGKRDGLIHAIYGGVYGKQHNVLDGHSRTGELMPVLTELGPAAASGLHYCESRFLGDEVQGNLLACSFNLHKVTRHKLVPSGATYQTQDSDFLTSESTDFHPTDVIEDADGSLLVCDTGGWYKLCCPTSQFHRPNILGTIYRIRRIGAAKVDDPRGEKVAWKNATVPALAASLGDSRPVVRDRAIELLAARGREAIVPLTTILQHDASAEQKLGAIWALCRVDDPAARAANVSALADSSPAVRHAAAHSAGLWRDQNALDRLCAALEDPSPAVARAAAEAIGRLGQSRAVSPLLLAGRRGDDRVLEHSIIYALIEIGDAPAIRSGLKAENPRTHRAAMMALSQLSPADLAAEDVLPLLTSPLSPLRDAAWWIAERRPDWGDRIVSALGARLSGPRTTEEDEQLLAALAQLSQNVAVQELVVRSIDDPQLAVESRDLALRTIARSGVSPTPDAWIDALLRAVEVPALQPEALASLQSLGLTKPQRDRSREAILRLAAVDGQPLELRLTALELLGDQVGDLSDALFGFVVSSLSEQTSALQRAVAAGVLAAANLTGEQKLMIAGLLNRLPGLELTRLLPIFEKSDQAVQQQVLAALSQSDNLGGVRRDVLTALVGRLAEPLRGDGESLLAKVDALNAQRRDRLEAIYKSLPEGDIERGFALFNSKRAACITCHSIAYAGGELGPDLTLIGKIRTDRDLLEAIVYPSASFVRSFEPLLIVTNEGQQFSGLVKQESPSEIVLATGAQTNQRIPRDEIDEMRPGQVSLMPEGFEKLLTLDELGDLIAYLKTRR